MNKYVERLYNGVIKENPTFEKTACERFGYSFLRLK